MSEFMAAIEQLERWEAAGVEPETIVLILSTDKGIVQAHFGHPIDVETKVMSS